MTFQEYTRETRCFEEICTGSFFLSNGFQFANHFSVRITSALGPEYSFIHNHVPVFLG